MADGFGELELELEGLGEYDSAFEHEAGAPEAFGVGDIADWAKTQWTAVGTPGTWQRKALLAADNAVLRGGGSALGAALGGPAGGVLGGAIGAGLAGAVVPEREFEFESETAFGGLNPVSRIYADAMMEQLGRAAMESESEFEAARHHLPLVYIAASKVLPAAARAHPHHVAKVVPTVARVITHTAPHMTHGVVNLTRTLHRNPRTRPLVRVVPSVARRAVATVARHAAAGRAVSPAQAVGILRHENRRILGNPQVVQTVLRRAHGMDRRFHGLGGIPGGAGHATGWGGAGARVCPTCGRPPAGRSCCCC